MSAPAPPQWTSVPGWTRAPVIEDVDPAGAIQRYKLTAAVETVKAFFMPKGAQ